MTSSTTTKPLTQRQIVEGLLRSHGHVSAHDLTYRHGITRSAAIVYTLRREGWGIDTTTEAGHQAEYTLTRLPRHLEAEATQISWLEESTP